MNRAELRKLAEDRLLDAQVLLAGPDGGRGSGAYYLAGYALECGLKACILTYIDRTGIIFQKGNKRFSEDCFTHNLTRLVELAGLKDELNDLQKRNGRFARFWTLVIDWSEESRYQQKSAGEAHRLFEAITDPSDGVLLWIKNYW